MSAETIVQVVNLGILVVLSVIFYSAVREDSPLRVKARWALLLVGVFLVGVGLLAGMSERSVASMLLLKHFGLGSGAICLGYSLMVAWLLCVFQPKARENEPE
jgi:hypothetical protein